MRPTVDTRRLTTNRTVLQPLEASDASSMHALWTDPGVRKYLWDDTVISPAQAAEVVAASAAHFEEHQFGLWAVCDRLTGDVMGFCGFRPAESGEPELLCGLWPRYWGQGLAHEAACAALAYAFRSLGCPEVVAATDVPNEASSRVLERLGMQFERRGTLNGLDTLFYRLRRDDFESESRPDVEIRPSRADDMGFMERMLFEAFYWSPSEERPPFEEFRETPEAVKLLADWGRCGDHCVIADKDGEPVGAAWYRLWTEPVHSYGFVDARTPELCIAVAPDYRSEGVGRCLLEALITTAREQGFQALSLSVSPLNPALCLYESRGFRRVDEFGTSLTLLLTL